MTAPDADILAERVLSKQAEGWWCEMTGSTERAAEANASRVPEAPEPAAGMSRKTLLRQAGLGIGTVLVVGSGAIGYRA